MNPESVAQVRNSGTDLYRSLVENIDDVIFRIECAPSTRFVYVSPSATSVTGYSPDEFCADAGFISRLVHPEDRHYMDFSSSGTAWAQSALVLRWIKKDGTVIWTEQRVALIAADDGRAVAVEGIARDITDRKKTELALRESEVRFRKYFELGLIGMAITSPEKGWVHVNDRLCEILGYPRDELIRKTWAEVTYPDDLKADVAQFERVLADEIDRYSLEKRFVHKDGHVVHASISAACIRREDGAIDHFVALVQDVSDRKKAEEEMAALQEQLNQAQKMDAIGQLASGVAHDFNNLLTVIFGNVELMEKSLDKSSNASAALRSVRDAAEQATSVTQALLTFSHRLPANRRPMDLQQVMDTSLRLLPRLLPAKVDLETQRVPEGTLFANVDQTQIQQVVMNLVVNARDAMPDGGRLTVSLVHQPDPPAEMAPFDGAQSGYALLSVADTGSGIKAAVKDRIFEPFFTTKPRGSGTGLGLAIVHGIVNEHGGTVLVDSNASGTTITVVLPAMTGNDTSHTPTAAPGVSLRPADGKLVIVAEDNKLVRDVIATYLHRQGYVVVQAVDGVDLLAKREKCKDSLTALVVDFEMPKMDGLEALRQIRRDGDLTPAILITAHIDEGLERRLDPHTTLFRKPFQIVDLATILASRSENE